MWSCAFGIDASKFPRAFKGLPIVFKEYNDLKRQNAVSAHKYKMGLTMPCLDDKSAPPGTASGHYFHQDLLVARKIYRRQPLKHVDVGSRIDGFVAHVATFRIIEVFDIRPLHTAIENVIFRTCDITSPEIDFVNYSDSVSCLHALEHFGLGRYGDSIDINGHLQGLNNLHRILQKNGILYLSVPIGPDRIDFNAHRVFGIKTVLDMVRDRFQLEEFSYVDDRGDLHEDIALNSDNIADNCGCYYGCGIFELRKA